MSIKYSYQIALISWMGFVGDLQSRVETGVHYLQVETVNDSLHGFLERPLPIRKIFWQIPQPPMTTTSFPKDLINSKQWSIHNYGDNSGNGSMGADVSLRKSWDITLGDTTVIIVFLNSGLPVDGSNTINHPDFVGTNRLALVPDTIPDFGVLANRDTTLDTSQITLTLHDFIGHGMRVAGVAAANSQSSSGIRGVCPECKVSPVKIFYNYRRSTYIDIVYGLAYVSEVFRPYFSNHKVIVNISAGSTEYDKENELRDAVELNTSLAIIAAAGNETGTVRPVHLPASLAPDYSHVIAVASSDHQDYLSNFSSFGPELTLSAPGGTTINKWGTPTVQYVQYPQIIWTTAPTYNYDDQDFTDHT